MPKNGLIQDFLENESYNFANIGNLNQLDDTLHTEGSTIFPKNLDVELWSDSG